MSLQDLPGIEARVNAAVRAHWRAFMLEGVLLVVFGLVAMIAPRLTSLIMTVFLGWVFVASGLAGLAQTLWARRTTGFWWSMLSALLAIVAGGVLLQQPARGAVAITIVVAAYFLAEGVATIMYALEHRRDLSERWNWMLVAGLMDIVIAAIIVASVPETAVKTLGLLVGVNLVFGGVALMGIARAARDGRSAV